jgi:hypothetical protein
VRFRVVRVRLGALVVAAGLIGTLPLWAQESHGDGASAEAGGTARVSLTFERAGFTVPRFVLEVDRNGRGTYGGDASARAAGVVSSEAGAQAGSAAFARSFAVTAGTAEKIFALAGKSGHFNVDCGTKAKNLADVGTHTLRYVGPDGAGACSFKYSDNKAVTELTALLHGIAETMDLGRELERLHRYDRLGLDEAMERLSGEVKDGRALEVGTIAETLRSIAGDEAVLQRVRTRAAGLLSQVRPADAAAA